MVKGNHLITHLFFVVVVSQAVKKVSASADMDIGNHLLSGKELKVAITHVFQYSFKSILKPMQNGI